MTPLFDIVLKGTSLLGRIQPFLISLTLTDEPGLKSDKLDLVLADQNLDLPQTGELLKVSLGYKETGLFDMGTFSIDGYTLSPKESRITAHAADFLENFKNPQARSFTETHLSEIVQKIASEHGLEAKIAPALTNIRLENLHQTAESDLHFLTRLGQQYNVLIKPSGHYLVAMPMGKGISPTGAALPGITLTPDSVMNWSLQCSKKEAVPSVTAKGYDTDSAEEFHETIGDEDDSDENMGYSLRGLYPTREAAKVAAQAVYEKLIQKAYTFSAEIPGNPQVLAESKLTLQGFRPGIPTVWILSRSSHSLSSSGYKTSLEAMVPTEFQKMGTEKDKA